ncbi:MAG: hypothetical protein Q4P15_13905 [Propionibacteriaceae bacterium]|nr:hypothetical protein [Propionibacteriaceae bacterium]
MAAHAYEVERSYTVNGRSENTVSAASVLACDTADDGHQIEAQFYRKNLSGRMEVRDNAGDGCSAHTINDTTYRVVQHRGVRLRLVDDVGVWKYVNGYLD